MRASCCITLWIALLVSPALAPAADDARLEERRRIHLENAEIFGITLH